MMRVEKILYEGAEAVAVAGSAEGFVCAKEMIFFMLVLSIKSFVVINLNQKLKKKHIWITVIMKYW